MHKEMFITVDGGLIQSIDVTADLEDVHVTVVDLDTDGAEPDEVATLPDWDEAFVNSFPVSKIGDGDLDYWKQVLKSE